MIVRVLLVVTCSLCCFWGCSQAGAAIPSGAAHSITADAAGHGQPGQMKLDYFNTPSKGAWPLYITAGPQGTLWFTEAFTDVKLAARLSTER